MSQISRSTIITSPKYSSTSNIPLRRTLSRQSSNSSTSSTKLPSKLPLDAAQRWRQKYEESEEKRKILLTEKEKALRSLREVEKKHLNLQVKHELLETELFEKNEEFTRLSTASKNLYKEYETLKNQYETETAAMARAMKDATQWYKENRELKRKTLLLVDKDTVDEGVDAGEAANDADIENLNKTIKQLSTEVAELQTELDAVKQSEFQALEQNMKLSEELEQFRSENESLKVEHKELLLEHKHLSRVYELLKKELDELREIREIQRTDIMELKKEAGEQKRERNVLAHQSNLLLQGLSADENGTDSLMLLQEIENLKRTLEEERTRYDEELNSLHERFEEQDTNSHEEILEERLKLVEAELEKAISRAEVAESKLKAPPLPPPPPPPPLPLISSGSAPPLVPLRRRKSRAATVEDLAKSIGVQETPEKLKPSAAAAAGVNEDIINAIKEGKFTLRKRKKDNNVDINNEKDKNAPKAVSELLNILGSLRRAPKKRQSLFVGVGDVSVVKPSELQE